MTLAVPPRGGRLTLVCSLAPCLGALAVLLPLAGAHAPSRAAARRPPTTDRHAVRTHAPRRPRPPAVPADPRGPDRADRPHGPGRHRRAGDVTVKFNDLTKKPSTPILTLLGLTLLSLVPAILLTCTSFTKILVVLGLTRNALGLQQIPPNQVLAGLALFLSLFIMSPVLKRDERTTGVQPYLRRRQDPDAGVRGRRRAAARLHARRRPATRRSRCSPTWPTGTEAGEAATTSR